MTKKELSEQIAERTGLTIEDSLKALEAFTAITKESVKNGEDVTIRGWGTLCLHKRNATTGRNITAGTSIRIPARNIVKFRAANEFAEAVK